MSSLFSIDSLTKIWTNPDQLVITDSEDGLSWSLFIQNVKILSTRLSGIESDSWMLYTEEPGEFLIAFLSLLYAGKNIHLPGVQPASNISPDGFPVLSDIKNISQVEISGIESGSVSSFVDKSDFNGQKIFFHTSGSTGEPKLVAKNLNQIEHELNALSGLWGAVLSDSTVYTTVSHQHFYGILFSILLPLVSGIGIASKRLSFPESLYTIPDEKVSLISSPAFLKRLGSVEKNPDDRNHRFSVFSSGGFLPFSTATICESFFGSRIREIYGSTETGGIAWKESPGNSLWKPFDVVTVFTEKEGLLQIRSPYLQSDDIFTLEDQIRIDENGLFELCGRQDSIVKVEEKRVALNDIENRILETGLVTDAAVFVMENKRQYIAVAIELNESGLEKFSGNDKKEINRFFRSYLASFFHPTVLPKKWRYPRQMPVNSQGKILKKEVVGLFDKTVSDEPVFLSESEVENGWIFKMIFPENYRYFDGHFPEMKILPAVVQVDCVMNILKSKLDESVYLDRMPRMKFQNPIFPDKEVDLKVVYLPEDLKVSFEYSVSDPKKIFSSGKIFLKETEQKL